MNLFEKISAIMGEVQYIQKDDHVSFKTTNYKAISEEKVTDLMHQAMVKYKLVVFPIKQEWTRMGDITHVDVTYRIVNAENPDESIEVVSCGDGYDTQDKGSGKAMTYAFKYMWLRTFAIPTGEDPDKISNEEIETVKAASKAKAKAEKIPQMAVVIEEPQLQFLEEMLKAKGYAGKNAIKGKKNSELTVEEYSNVMEWLKNQPNK